MLGRLLTAEPWMRHGVCHVERIDPAVFFPEQGRAVWTAKQFCKRCPVRADCLEYALRANEHHGVWGGESERSRQRLRRAAAGTNQRKDQGA